MQYSSRALRLSFLLAAGALALSACAAVPPAGTAAQPRSASDLALPASFAGDSAFPADTWWQAYRDPGLDALMAEALAASPDMAVAAARIAAADAQARQVGAATLPAVGAEAAVSGTKQSYNMGIPEAFVPKGVVDTGRIAATLGLDLDLWGRTRAALAAARGEAEAARADAAQARLLLTSALALAWGDLAQTLANRALAAEQLELWRETERLTVARQRAGVDSMAEVQTARARRAGAAQTLAALDEAAMLGRNRIAALVGAGPGRAATLPAPQLDLAASTGVPATLAADLVGRRPDLAAARLRAESAAQRIAMARAEFYPSINLAAVVGLQSLGLGQLFDGGSTYANFGPALSLPLFQGGRLQGRYDAAGAGYAEAVARYDQTLLGALREVADALDSKRALAGRLAAAEAADRAAAEAARLVRLRRQQGIASQLQVLGAEDTALAARRQLTDLRIRAYLIDVMLVKALGGGFAAPATPDRTAKP